MSLRAIRNSLTCISCLCQKERPQKPVYILMLPQLSFHVCTSLPRQEAKWGANIFSSKWQCQLKINLHLPVPTIPGKSLLSIHFLSHYACSLWCLYSCFNTKLQTQHFLWMSTGKFTRSKSEECFWIAPVTFLSIFLQLLWLDVSEVHCILSYCTTDGMFASSRGHLI